MLLDNFRFQSNFPTVFVRHSYGKVLSVLDCLAHSRGIFICLSIQVLLNQNKKKYKSAFIDSHIRQISYSLVLIKLFCEKAKKRKYKYIVKMGCGIAIVKFILFVFNLVCAVSISFRI